MKDSNNKREKVLDSRMAVHGDVCLRWCHEKSENRGVNWKELFLALLSTSQEEKKRKENSNAEKGQEETGFNTRFFRKFLERIG